MPPSTDFERAAPAAGPGPAVHSAAADVGGRLDDVRARIAAAARRAGRSPHAVTLVAVTKTFDADVVRAALRAGQIDIGEARAQELRAKATEIGGGVRWHFVGRLQRNKVKDVVGTASLVHSVDRLELAEAIAERARALGRVQRVLVQVNVGDDPAKGGCGVDEAAALVGRVREVPGIACEGLMTIPPMDVDPRAMFGRLRDLRDEICAHFPEVMHLSMGMSGDFEAAVESGATIVRVGEAVFGPRPQPA